MDQTNDPSTSLSEHLIDDEGEKPPSLMARNAYGLTPLHALVRSARWRGADEVLPLVQKLLEEGAAPNTGSYSGRTAVWEALDANCDKIVDTLVQAGATGDEGDDARGQLETRKIERDDIEKIWWYNSLVRRATAQLLWTDEKLNIKTYMTVASEVFSNLSNTKGRDSKSAHSKGAHLLGADLYQDLHRDLTTYDTEVLASMQAATSDAELLGFYTREWTHHSRVAKQLDRLFAFLNRHWVMREKSEGETDIHFVYDLCVKSWVTNIAEKDSRIRDVVMASMKHDSGKDLLTEAELLSMGLSFAATQDAEYLTPRHKSS